VVVDPFLNDRLAGDYAVGCGGVDAFYEMAFEVIVTEDEVNGL
jgi:hypothetical protein